MKQVLFLLTMFMCFEVFGDAYDNKVLNIETVETNWLEVNIFEYVFLVREKEYRVVFDGDEKLVISYVDGEKYIQHNYHPKLFPKNKKLVTELPPLYHLELYSEFEEDTTKRGNCGNAWSNFDRVMGVYAYALANGASEAVLQHLADACQEAFMQLMFCIIK